MQIHASPRRRTPSFLASLAVLGLGLGLAHGASAQLTDAKGSKDHSLISRYAGSIIIGYDEKKFDEFTLPMGPIERTDKPSFGDVALTKSQPLEGRVTRILYVPPEGRSSLEVFRNYEQALKKAGFQVLYTCNGDACGVKDGELGERVLYGEGRKMTNTPPPGTGAPQGQMSEYAFNFAKDQRYFAAKLPRAEGDVYVSLYVAIEEFEHFPETHNRAVTLVEVIETTPMETGMVTVDAAAMAKDITATGHVALYGIYFDTDKADVKPESEPALQEISKLLQQDGSLKLYVVGHTDNVGGFDYNMNLSNRRAASVVKALTTKYGVAAARLRAAGAGLLAPVAPNDTEEGRAKNRRVELVEQ
jgi:outer membrane protein OmpA-like peptidoglycan-associated protein